MHFLVKNNNVMEFSFSDEFFDVDQEEKDKDERERKKRFAYVPKQCSTKVTLCIIHVTYQLFFKMQFVFSCSSLFARL